MNLINEITLISNEFKLNLDLFETNIINLSIVLLTIVIYGKKILEETVENRINSISKIIEESELKYKIASENLENAKNKLIEAKQESEKIKKQGKELADKTKKKIIYSNTQEIKRLEETNLNLIKLEEEKFILEVVKLK